MAGNVGGESPPSRPRHMPSLSTASLPAPDDAPQFERPHHRPTLSLASSRADVSGEPDESADSDGRRQRTHTPRRRNVFANRLNGRSLTVRAPLQHPRRFPALLRRTSSIGGAPLLLPWFPAAAAADDGSQEADNDDESRDHPHLLSPPASPYSSVAPSADGHADELMPRLLDSFTGRASPASGHTPRWTAASLRGTPEHSAALLLPHVATPSRPDRRRWVVLALSCCLLFGNYYAYDNPAAINTLLREHLGMPYDEWQLQLNAMYAVYSLPNTLLPLVGGSLLDRHDPRLVLLLFSSCVLLGQLLFAVGVSGRWTAVMLAGRVFFGIGGESCSVVQSWIVAGWFRGREVAFALGLTLSIARLGSVANSILSPRFAERWGVPAAVWAGQLMCVASFACGVVLCGLMGRAAFPKAACAEKGLEQPSSTLSDLLREQNVAIVAAVDDVGTEDEESAPLLTRPVKIPAKPVGIARVYYEAIREALAFFPNMFWVLCAICILLYGTVVPFNNVVSDFLQSKWYPGDPERAGLVMSIPDTLSAVLVPPLGLMVDRAGRRGTLLVVCSATIAAAHLVLGLTGVSPVLPFVALGVSYSIYGVAIWPSVACVVERAEAAAGVGEQGSSGHLGMAYGIATAALNSALTLCPLLVAFVRVASMPSWAPLELLFAGMALSACALGILLYSMDLCSGRFLERPSAAGS